MNNTFSLLFVVFLLFGVLIEGLLLLRHRRHVGAHRATVPPLFTDRITTEQHHKAADYTIAKSSLALSELGLGVVILLGWTLGGGLNLVDGLWRDAGLEPLWTGVAVMLSVMLISSLIDIPVSVYRTFVLEQRFGFNRMTTKLYLADLAKNLVLAILIGVPMLALVLWLMENAGSYWWLYVWLTWLGFSLFMMWFYPAFIAPLFNKFRPLEEASLRERIEALLTRNGFASRGIFVMDGSTRSTHGNAYFTGVGNNKRIVFFDTLINELSHEEIEAVLAHELGHFRRHHIRKRIALMAVIFLAGLWLLGLLIDAPWFYAGLGVDQPSTWMALILFTMVIPVFTFFMEPLLAWYSRRHEFEADDFAAEQSQASHLIQALVKLYRENANTLTPDPWYSAFHDSHPPAPVRIAHLTAGN